MEQPGSSVWVGNLPTSLTEAELVNVMSIYGPVQSVKLLFDKKGRPRGCAYIDFSNPMEAQEAITGVNGHALSGSTTPLVARLAAPKPTPVTLAARVPRAVPLGGVGPIRRAMARPIAAFAHPYATPALRQGYPSAMFPKPKKASASGTSLWINHLPPTYTEEDLYGLCAPFGQISSVKVVPHKQGGVAKFLNPQAAASALTTLNGLYLSDSGVPLEVIYSDRQAAVTSAFPTRASAVPLSRRSLVNPAAAASLPPRGQGSGTSLWVGGVPVNYTEQDLVSLFEPFGRITFAALHPDSTGRGLSQEATLQFKAPQEASSALKTLDGLALNGSSIPLEVMYAEKRGITVNPTPPVQASTIPIQKGQLSHVAELLPTKGEGSGTSLWIGGLPVTYTDDDLIALFQPFGRVTFVGLMADSTGQGLTQEGTVKFKAPQEAATAMKTLNSVVLDGSQFPLNVMFSERRLAEVDPDAARSNQTPGPYNDPSIPTSKDSLWVGKVPKHLTQEDVLALFLPFGTVVSCELHQSKKSGSQRLNTAIVKYARHEEAANAVAALNDMVVDPSTPPLAVRFEKLLPHPLTKPVAAAPPARFAVPLRRPAMRPRAALYHPYM